MIWLALFLVFTLWYWKMFDIHTYDSACLGLRFWKLGSRTKELWIIKPHYQIQAHSHPNEQIELQYVYGSNTVFHRDSVQRGIVEMFEPTWKHWLKKFTVPANTIHWFEVSKSYLVFINHAQWLNNTAPTSASTDFKPAY